MLNEFDALRELIEDELAENLPVSSLCCTTTLNAALRYAVFPGGKRIRPLLTMLGSRLCSECADCALPAACAVEYLHASSLILDDLPAMDDAQLRRGRPALHLEFGQSAALLAAFALLNQAYALFGKSTMLIQEAAQCIGSEGMIGGQAIDLEAHLGDGSVIPFSARNRKTSALMRLTLTAGAILCNAPGGDIAVLAQVGECLGEAYQVCDDLLDQQFQCEVTGKNAFQDARHVRPSLALEFGSAQSLMHVTEHMDTARALLIEHFGRTRGTMNLISFFDAIIREFKFESVATA